jgi:Dolichyl-phosphate-mannose-protein mannosyltransferase
MAITRAVSDINSPGEVTEVAAPVSKPQTIAPRASRGPLLVFAGALVVAAAAYSHGLGANALGASETYSAWAAARPGIGAIVAIPINHDPGKVIGYYVALHYWAAWFGTGEIGLRSFSAVLALADLALLFLLGRELFDDETAAAAAAMWALLPYAVTFARRARMYPLVIALALAHLLLLWRTRRRPSAAGAAASGALGAALLYTHLGGMLVIGAEAAMLARDFIRGQRNATPWLALALALALFAPILPITMAEARVLVRGEALDWIAAASQYSPAMKVAAAAIALAAAAWLVLGRDIEPWGDEPVRWLLAWAALPALALLTGSIVVRPMFNLRYVAPALAASVLLVSEGLAMIAGAKVRNLAAAAIATACIVLIRFSFVPSQPWREIARTVATGAATEPVFFEAGYVSHGVHARTPNDGFPFGYYLIPFNYYYKGGNPRLIVPGYDPAAARRTIDERVEAAGGGWLISWKTAAEAAQELPDPARCYSAAPIKSEDLTVYRIVPLPQR